MRYLILVFFYLSMLSGAYSQNLQGTAKNNLGEPLVTAIVCIDETRQQFICNQRGAFQAQLPDGNYTLTFKHIGYKNVVRQCSVRNTACTRFDIILSDDQPLPITFRNDEDPANDVMRNTLQKVPLYSNRISTYTAELYANEKIRLSKTSKIVTRIIKETKGVNAKNMIGKTYMQESVNELNYIAPNQYLQTVKAASSSVPNKLQMNEVFEYVNGTIYTPAYERFISPLDANAFLYYNFKHEGLFEQDKHAVHKIKVIPKYNDPKLLTGNIFIENNTWHLLKSDLTAELFGLTQNFVIRYQQIEEGVYLPTIYIFNSNLNFLGNSGKLSLYASLKYKHIATNDSLSIINGDVLTKKRNFQVHSDSLHIITTDSLAFKLDSTYWKKFREIPMDANELEAFKDKDSIQNQIDSIQKKFRKFKFTPSTLILGGKISGDSSLISLSYNGILFVVPEYNYVDGFWIGERFAIEKKMNRKVYNLKLSPFIYYTTARHRIIGGVDFEMEYLPMKLGKLTVSTGSASADFNFKSADRLDNAVSSLFLGWNESNYYQKDYIAASNDIDISNGLKLEVGFEIANRQGLPNNTKYAILANGTSIQPNMKDGEDFDKTSYYIDLKYTPYAYYSVKNGIKRYEYQTSPTFNVSFKQGIKNENQKNSSVYNKISVGIEQNVRLGHFSNLNYFINSGSFLWSVKNTDFTDYYHFRSSNVFSTSKMPYDSYLLMNNYRYSTNSHWVDARINYTSRYIFLKRLPFLQGKPFDENLHLKGFYTPQTGIYNEMGYSLNISSFLNFGVYTSFQKLKYRRFAVRLSWVLPSIKF